MTFVRLTGCNAAALGLRCVRWCDTAESWDPQAGVELDVLQVADRIDLPRTCLTGGEPLLQAEALASLVPLLQKRGRLVHLESNGTLPLPDEVRPDWLTVSPKPPDGQVDEIKLVVDEAFDRAALAKAEDLARDFPEALLCLQPEASGGQPLAKKTVALVMNHPHWRLSLQMHKVLGIS
jgi:organic radical activating enzyme